MKKLLLLALLVGALVTEAAWQASDRLDAAGLRKFGNESKGQVALKLEGTDVVCAEMAAPLTRRCCFYTGPLGQPEQGEKGKKRLLKLEMDVRGEAFKGTFAYQMLATHRASRQNSWMRHDEQSVDVTPEWQTVTTYWNFNDEFMGLRVYFFCGDSSTGKLLFRNMKLTEVPYSKWLATSSLPINGKLVARDQFNDGSLCGWYKSKNEDDSYTLTSEDGVLCMKLLGTEKKNRLVIHQTQVLPHLDFGQSAVLRIKMRIKSPDLQKVDVCFRPLYRTQDNNVSFPPLLWKPAVTPEWQTIEQEWPLNGIDAINSHLFVTASEQGTLMLDDVEIKVLPVDSHVISTGTDGNIIDADSGEISVIPVHPEKVTGGSITVTDLHGTDFAPVMLQKGTPEYKIALPHKGFYRISVKADYQDGRKIAGESAAVVAGPKLPEDVWKKTRFGICSVRAEQDYTADLGGRWDWKFMNFANARLDENGHVKPFAAWSPMRGQRMEAILAGSGSFPSFIKAAREDTAKLRIYEPADWELYRELITAMAKGTKLPEWTCIWNEPECVWRDSLEAYVKWMRITGEAIHAVQPNVKFTGPGHCNINMKMMRELGDLGLFDCLDGVTMHPYVNGTAPEGDFIHRIYELQEYLDSIGKGHLPMFFTEFGWTTGKGGWQPPVDELTKYRYTTRSLALTATSRVKGIAYFCLHYHVDSISETEFSLVWPDKTPRMALAAYIAICRNLGRYTTPGKWLQLSPALHLTLFSEGTGDMTCVAWNTDGEAVVNLPFAVQTAAWSDNAPCAVASDGRWTLSPDPLFLQSQDASLFNYEKAGKTTCFAGAKLPLAAEPVLVSAPLSWKNGELTVPLEAVKGTYTVLTRENGCWRAYEYTVTDALTVKEPRLAQTQDGGLQLLATVTSALKQDVELRLKVKQGGRNYVGQPSMVPAGGSRELAVAVEAAAHLSDSLAEVTASPADAAACKDSEAVKANLGVLNCYRFAEGNEDWSKVPVLASSEFKSLDGRTWLAEKEDCSAQLQLAYTDQALLLRIAVQDNDHVFTVEPQEMWRQDSIQLGIDADGGKPFSPNMQFGFNGHRIFEYGFAGRADGSTVNWRWLAYHPLIKTLGTEPLIKTEFRRDGEKSVYTIRIPYAAIGLDKAPQSGETFALALLVNDADSKPYEAKDARRRFAAGQRHGLRLFDGIVGEKRFGDYGLVFFR